VSAPRLGRRRGDERHQDPAPPRHAQALGRSRRLHEELRDQRHRRAPGHGRRGQRLLRNQDEIGNAIKPYYGEEAGRKLATLLRDHIKIASEVVKAAKAGQTTELNAAQSRWSQNGKDIAALLSGANPNWPKAELESMLQQHLDLLTDQVSSRLKKNWAAEMKAYDAGHDHMMMLADTLSEGIEKQFPNKFAGA
jgi:hypothetical protein